MGKATTLPNDVKKTQVVLTTYDEETDTTKVVTRDGKNWYSKYGSNWSEEDPNKGHTPKYDPAQEEYDEPEASIREEVIEGEEEEEAPPPKTEAELKAEAAASKAANVRTAAAQKKAASEGGPQNKQNELLNRQARLAGEGVTNQAPIDGGPGGSGGIRTLTEREIEILEESEEGAEARKAERQEAIAAAPGIDNTLPDAEAEAEVAGLKEEVARLRKELQQKNIMVAKQQVAMAGKSEGVPVDDSAPVFIAPSPMAGPMSW